MGQPVDAYYVTKRYEKNSLTEGKKQGYRLGVGMGSLPGDVLNGLT